MCSSAVPGEGRPRGERRAERGQLAAVAVATEVQRSWEGAAAGHPRALGLPVAWNLAGGYQEPTSRVIDLHVATARVRPGVPVAPGLWRLGLPRARAGGRS